jgi:hypothetical protein
MLGPRSSERTFIQLAEGLRAAFVAGAAVSDIGNLAITDLGSVLYIHN